MTNRLASIIALTLSFGCGTSLRETVINAPPRAMQARPVETVEMFTSGAPSRPHVDVAFIEAEETSSFSVDETPEMLRSLRERAAARGCDGVVIGGLSSREPGVGDAESWMNERPKARKGVYATCIVYTAPPAVVTAAPPAAVTSAPPAAPPAGPETASAPVAR